MSKSTLYTCDRCKKEGKTGFAHEVRFTYGRHYDGVESSNSDAVVDLCARCACLCLSEFITKLGHDGVYKYILTQKWINADEHMR